ncbi:MAG: band 7 protein [Flavobacteriales bacterium]|nr:MAG: band 7 protein [Flavobacteriales bacterium]
MYFFIFLGILLIILSMGMKTVDKRNPLVKQMGLLKYLGIILIGIGILASTFVQINPGMVGVKSLFGKVRSDVLESGLHMVNPLLDITYFDIKTQNYTMSALHAEGLKRGDDAIRVLSNDGLEVVIDLTVLYRIIPEEAPNIYQKIGEDYNDKIVRPVTRTRIRDNAVFYDAVALYSTKRDEFQQRIFSTIEKDFNDRGLVLEQLLIRNINLPASVKDAIEQKINAEQEAQKMVFVLQKETQEAERKRVEAQGIADYQSKINSTLTNRLLEYELIKAQKELAGSDNAKMVILNGKNTPIMLNSN